MCKLPAGIATIIRYYTLRDSARSFLRNFVLILSGPSAKTVSRKHLHPPRAIFEELRIFMALLDQAHTVHIPVAFSSCSVQQSTPLIATLSLSLHSSLSKVVNRLISRRVWSIWKASLRFSARRFPFSLRGIHRLTSSSGCFLRLT